MFRLFLTACILAAAWAAVPNPKTPNQILDAVIERANAKIKGLSWDDYKKVQNGETDFSLGVDTNGKQSSNAEDFQITNAKITGLLLARARSAKFANNKTVLKGTLKLTDTRAIADYEIKFPGEGAVDGHTVKGTLVEKADHLFADIEIQLENLVPKAILSYEVSSGREELESSSGLNKDWSAIDTAGIRGSLLQLLKQTFSTNLKVQVNQSIKEWYAESQA